MWLSKIEHGKLQNEWIGWIKCEATLRHDMIK
jgi:hypothetical protein